jgi:hypothetical protein
MDRTHERPLAVLAIAAAIGSVAGCTDGLCLAPAVKTYCAATFDEQAQRELSDNPFDCPYGGPCGPSYRVWRTAPNLGSLTCIYDQSGQHLLSAVSCSDTNQFCGNSSFCETGGQVIDPDKECDTSALPRTCGGASGVDAGQGG